MKRAGILALILGLPLLGAWKAERPLAPFFEFPPPENLPADCPGFSWAAAAAVVLLVGAVAFSWVSALIRKSSRPRPPPDPRRPFPRWGWVAAGWTLLWWGIAWTQDPALRILGENSFFPLWLGFIVFLNALTQWKTGRCGMRDSPGRWIGLFAASACFWWCFEWLNRFVGNWHYLTAEPYGPFAYAAHASLCFSTVLPAVAAASEALRALPGWDSRTAAGPRWRWFGSKAAAMTMLAGGILALVLAGMRPRDAYPALWLAPPALIIGEGILSGRQGFWSELAAGDWRRAAAWMVGALICGFFWELWNYESLPKWTYTVPYVQGWRLFEMPLAGYAGYLPFGLECLLAAELVRKPGAAEVR